MNLVENSPVKQHRNFWADMVLNRLTVQLKMMLLQVLEHNDQLLDYQKNEALAKFLNVMKKKPINKKFLLKGKGITKFLKMIL